MDIGTITAIAIGIIIVLALLVAVIAVIVNAIAEGAEFEGAWQPEDSRYLKPLVDESDTGDPNSLASWRL